MIKTAAIFPRQAALNSTPVLTAVRQALIRHGVIVVEDTLEADAVIMWSVLWAGRMATNQAVYEHYSRHQRPIIVVDVGSLIRGITWKIAMGNINREGWFGDPIDWDLDRPSKLGVRREAAAAGDAVLIAAQHRRSLQAREITNTEQWIAHNISRVRQWSDRPIVIRPHPRDPVRLGHLPRGVSLQSPRAVSGTYDSFDWQDIWHAVINHNSGPGVLAGIAGVRPIVDKSSLAWPVAIDLNHIEQPYEIDRDQWLTELAHTEYTLDEIDQGLWLRRLGSRL